MKLVSQSWLQTQYACKHMRFNFVKKNRVIHKIIKTGCHQSIFIRKRYYTLFGARTTNNRISASEIVGQRQHKNICIMYFMAFSYWTTQLQHSLAIHTLFFDATFFLFIHILNSMFNNGQYFHDTNSNRRKNEVISIQNT